MCRFWEQKEIHTHKNPIFSTSLLFVGSPLCVQFFRLFISSEFLLSSASSVPPLVCGDIFSFNLFYVLLRRHKNLSAHQLLLKASRPTVSVKKARDSLQTAVLSGFSPSMFCPRDFRYINVFVVTSQHTRLALTFRISLHCRYSSSLSLIGSIVSYLHGWFCTDVTRNSW